jgi:hypothetical protein
MSGGSNSTLSSVARSTVGGLPIVGDVMRGDTAQDLAQAQGDAAMAQLRQQQADREQALKIAQPTDLQMTELHNAINTNNTDISRKQALLNSADPAFIEAGKQALAIMKGGDTATTAAALQPIQQQRDNQRSQLMQRLQQQLGPGWESSTTGQQALASFDAQTASTLNNARLGTLAQLMGYTGASEQFGNLQPNIANSQSIIDTQGRMQERQIGAITGTPITMAGAPFAGQIASDQYAIGQMSGAQNTLGNLYGFVKSGGQTNPFNGKSTPSPMSGGGGSSGGGGGGSMLGIGNFATTMAKGGMVRMRYADGGYVVDTDAVMQALEHPNKDDDEKSGGSGIDPSMLMSLATLMAARGGRVPGHAVVRGDSRRNDLVPALLSPGEIVLPRTVVAKGAKAEAAFAERAKRKRA